MKKLSLVLTLMLALFSAGMLTACNGGSEEETQAVEQVVAKSTAIEIDHECWDINNSGDCETEYEDFNSWTAATGISKGVKDGRCTSADCVGNDGKDGKDGTNCWDHLVVNGKCDPIEAAIAEPFNLCGSEDCVGKDGKNAITRVTAIPVGDTDCPNGGTLFAAGYDDNADKTLQDSEITSSSKMCSIKGDTGADGKTTLITIEDEAAGVNCVTGGKKITVALDVNNNGVIDAGENAKLQFVCNGKDGEDGVDGKDGTNGKDGVSWPSRQIPLPGPTTQCPNGGLLDQIGPDLNGNGTLDDDEVFPDVSSGQQLCNGKDGTNGTNGKDGDTCVPKRIVGTDSCNWYCGSTAEQIALAATAPSFTCPRIIVKDNDGDCKMGNKPDGYDVNSDDYKLTSDNPLCGSTIQFTWDDTIDSYANYENGLACYSETLKSVVMYQRGTGAGCTDTYRPSFYTYLGAYDCSTELPCGSPLTCDETTHHCVAPVEDGDTDTETEEDGDTDSTESEVTEDGDTDTETEEDGDTDSTESEVTEDGDTDTETDSDTSEVHPRFAMEISVAGLTLYHWGEAGKFLGSRTSVAGMNDWLGASGNGSIVLGGSLPDGAICTCHEDGYDPWSCTVLFTGSFGCGTLGPVPEIPVGGDIDQPRFGTRLARALFFKDVLMFRPKV